MPVLNESFSVPNGAQSWAVINDLNKLIPCVPGAKVIATESPTKATAEITVKMGSMGMVFTGPVEIESATRAQTAKIKANTTREGRPEQRRRRRHDHRRRGNPVSINANAQRRPARPASMGEGTVVAVLTQLVKSFAGEPRARRRQPPPAGAPTSGARRAVRAARARRTAPRQLA